MNDYKPASRPAAFGAVAVALAAMTIGLTVVLPAKIDSAQEPRTAAAPQITDAPAVDADAGPMRVEVIARRGTAWTTVHTRVRAPQRERQASDRRGTHATAAPDHLGHADAGLQRTSCPYLIKGTVAATS
jgi:hypothetical protein